MSDDRFKQARKNLRDKHKQRQQGSGLPLEDQPTSAIGIDRRPGRPKNGSMIIGDDFDEGFGEEATAFVNVQAMQNGPPALPPALPNTQNFGSDDGDFGGEATDFVNVNDLQMDMGNQILTDSVLTQTYQYGPESIQNLASTLIFAQKADGQSVILKRVWNGDPAAFPDDLRERISAVDVVRHPNLVSLNGMLATPTGVWLELTRPPGYRLTDVLTQNGPQPNVVVFGWLTGVGEALDEIHRNGYIHAGLTPDAIWVKSDGGVMLEPFDLLAFEDRGNLAPYGPREMTYAPEQRELTSSTDTFCLANIAFAALTGLPLDLAKAGEVDPIVGKALQRALSANPRERFSTAAEFLKPFQNLEKKKGILPDLNFKFLIMAVGILMIGVVGLLYFQQQQSANAKRAAALANAAPTPFEVPEEGPDPRIKVIVDLKNDPLNRLAPRLLDKAEKRKVEQARIEAREELKGVEKLPSGQRKTKYTTSLSTITRAILISGETKEDTVFIKELRKRKDVIKMRKDYFTRITDSLEKGKSGSARINYTSYAAIEPEAPGLAFFNTNKTAKVERLVSISEQQKKEEK